MGSNKSSIYLDGDDDEIGSVNHNDEIGDEDEDGDMVPLSIEKAKDEIPEEESEFEKMLLN